MTEPSLTYVSEPTYLPARREEIAMLDRRTDSWTAVVIEVARLAEQICRTELVPEALYNKPAAITAVILYGREIGLPPMTALRSSHVVNGRVAIAAEIMRGLVLAAGHELYFREATGARCVAVGRRRGQENASEVEWTLDMARAAGIVNKPVWKSYPRAMLKARATAELCRDLFADVIGGFSAVEELEEAVAETPDTTPRRTVRRAQPPAGDETRTGTGDEPAAPRGNESARQAPARPASDRAASGSAGAPAGPTFEVPLPGEPGYDDLAGPAPATENPPAPEPAPAPRDTSDWRVTKPQLAKIHAQLGELGVTERPLALRFLSAIVGRTVDSSADLTRGEMSTAIDTLTRIQATEAMAAEITRIVAADDPLREFDRLFHTLPIDDESEDT